MKVYTIRFDAYYKWQAKRNNNPDRWSSNILINDLFVRTGNETFI